MRIWLNVSPGWYGFTLVVPVFALMAAVLFERKRLAVVWLIPIAVMCGRGLWAQHEKFALKRYPIVSTRGTFFDANRDRAAIVTSFLQHVHGGTLAFDSAPGRGTTVKLVLPARQAGRASRHE